MTFSELKKNLKKDFSKLPVAKVAILGDTPTQLLLQALKAYGYEAGLNFEILEADHNQIDLQIQNSTSELYRFEPDYVIIFQSAQKLVSAFYSKALNEKLSFADDQIHYVEQIVARLINNLNTKIIYLNFEETDDGVFGNYANKTAASFLYQVRKINTGLMELAQKTSCLFICDIASLTARVGQGSAFSPAIYANTGIVFDLDFWPVVAKNITDIILALTGRFKKAIVLDLDDTLWGGLIGDNGIEGIQIGELGIGRIFTEFQTWLKQLKERGIILAVCSKNYEDVAREPFEKHPDMVLRLEDIAVFVANWENKVDNIRYIQTVLNIGFDAMVYLDDNAFERNMVRQALAELCIPELPEDPAEYLGYLQGLNLFETAGITAEDAERTIQYQEEAKRLNMQNAYANEDEFLQSLEMESEVARFNKFNTPRVAQLSQRSNQFNLRTIRYTAADIERISRDNSYIPFAFSLADKFGDYGMISAVILKIEGSQAFIETWFMSCRVLKRGMESFVLNNIAGEAKARGCTELVGEYIPTAKNELVRDHFKKLGFKPEAEKWKLDLTTFENRKAYIKIKNNARD